MGDIGQGGGRSEGAEDICDSRGGYGILHPTSSLLGPGESWSRLDRQPSVEGQGSGVCLPTAACQGPVSKN